jgi:hypothetical protein
MLPAHAAIARRPRLRGVLGLSLGLYLAVLVAGPALHHDLACHLKSRTHCTSCLVSVTGPRSMGAVGLVTADRRDAGQLLRETPAGEPIQSRTPRHGRGPPA